MTLEDRSKLAALLRKAASQTILENDFWKEFNALSGRVNEPIVEIALETATHYWGNFHQRSIFFLIPVRPNPGQLGQGRNELSLIAEALESEWELRTLEEKLKDI